MSKWKILLISLLVLLIVGVIAFIILWNNKEDNNNDIVDTDKSEQILEGFNSMISSTPDPYHIIEYLNNNMKDVNKSTADKMLYESLKVNKAYINEITASDLYELLETKYPDGVVDKIKQLNSLEGITDIEVIDMMMKYKNIGYKLYTAEATIWADVNYKFYIDNYGKYLSQEANDYLAIKENAATNYVVSDAEITVSFDELSNRIVDIEKFIKSYPNSNYFEEMNNLYKIYLEFYLFGSDNTITYDRSTKVMRDDVLESYNTTLNKYPNTNLATLVEHWQTKLHANNNKFNDNIKNEMLSEIHK